MASVHFRCYTRDDLIRYVTMLEVLIHESQGVISTPSSRIRQFEGANASCHW